MTIADSDQKRINSAFIIIKKINLEITCPYLQWHSA
jgi:hypothetical protein